MDTVISEVRVQSQKEQQWSNAERKVADLERKDVHGIKIDPKIRKTVTGLTAFNLPTVMSCEGHLDHGGGYPYITISAPEARQHEHDAQITYVIGRHEEHDRLKARARQFNMKFMPQLQKYLDEFYSARPTPDKAKLTAQMSDESSAISLASQGISEQKNAALDEKSANLVIFQTEMEDFGKFLEERFFAEG